MNILILHPDFRDPGGVANYYSKLKNKFSLHVTHYILGRRPEETGLLSKIYRMISDYRRFVVTLKKNNYEVIHVNPSLDPKSFMRDGFFLLLARMYKKKTVVFFRGWQETFEKKITQKGLWLFKLLYGKSDAFIVLSEDFIRILESWGCNQPVYREVTVFDDNALQGFEIQRAIKERKKSKKRRILFLSRIYREKGIYETIKAFSILQLKYPDLELIIAGDGPELDSAKSFVRAQSVINVKFTGYVRGKEKIDLLKNSYLFCFPTYYGEGLSNSIIESMAFGLPIITRPVGGIADLVKNGEHGFVTTDKDPEVIADSIERLFENEELYEKISLHNYYYSQTNFMASQAARRLEKIYSNVLRANSS